jgi:2C-methyl-D-erythritol 2,4-cyclodiphosphate synthase
MRKLPEVQSSKPNETLRSYFAVVQKEIGDLTGTQRETQLQRYVSYIELEAQKAKSIAVRLQLRINLQSMLEKLGEVLPEAEIEVNVKARTNKALPRFGDEAYYEVQLI